MSGIKEQLLEMGFTNDQVTLAIKHSSTLESAIEFISNPKQDDEGEILHENVTAASLQCDDCGRLFRDGDAATLHATKSSHQNFRYFLLI